MVAARAAVSCRLHGASLVRHPLVFAISKTRYAVITNVHGDILLSNARAIAHGVAPHDHFNQGLALALREHHPAMAKDFRHYCRQENPKPGHAWLWAGPERVVINLMTRIPYLLNAFGIFCYLSFLSFTDVREMNGIYYLSR